ncbi:MAG: 1,4-alpha-glucan branching protein GlgB [Candidatus Margulisiibacteriota bacterium]|jgi:1,4-alpha-glucan branching enzyme
MKQLSLKDQIKGLVEYNYLNHFDILGLHTIEVDNTKISVIRAYEPNAKEVYIIDPENPKKIYKMKEKYETYFFEYEFKKEVSFKHYQLKVVYSDDNSTIFYHPYSFKPDFLTEYELFLHGEGNFHKSYQKLGAHLRVIDGISGISFAVWAPNAKRVSVLGDFNDWDGRHSVMKLRGASGIWEFFIPGLALGTIYKYEIKTQFDHLYQKIDPYAYSSELRPKSGSVVADLNSYIWHDTEWIAKRTNTNPLEQPISIYEVHLGSWMRGEENGFLNYRDLAHKLGDYVKKMGFTHIELMPIAEHPFDGSWGYQVLSYYAPTSRFGNPEDFMYFVDYMHQQEIGVLMDWVPAHFPKDNHGLSFYDGTHLYEHQDWRKAEHKDWGTLIFNYGRNEVRNFLVSNAIFWFEKYHLDGLRVDAVASMLYLDYSRKEGEWIPNCFGGRENLEAIHFLQKTNELIFNYFPNVIMAAEESTAWPGVSKPVYLGGLGFNFKWNMGWMNDFLEYITKESIHRKYHQNLITFALLYAFHENFVLSLSHDEVVYGKKSLLSKMPGDMWQKFANMRSLITFMYGHPGKKLLFMGSEFGQWNEWNEKISLDWHLTEYDNHAKLQKCIQDLNALYKNEPAFYEEDFSWQGFEWIDFSDAENSVITFIRWSKNHQEALIFVCNFTPVPRENYRVGVPINAYYQELFNSDSEHYGGSNIGNNFGVHSDEIEWNNRKYSLKLTLPPLSASIFKVKN